MSEFSFSKSNSRHVDEIVDGDDTSVTSGVSDESPESSNVYDDVEIVEPVQGYKKVLVTGGAGFIGRNVTDKLFECVDDVVIVDEMNDYYDMQIKEANLKVLKLKYGPFRLSIYRGDICDEDFMILSV
mmetsp:Transcript_12693/g.18096  ORF Transcript_12693/g.18096 Transcript_12693/m.18096 type:complete len:128 (-) Transcript_12693:34-417(-)